MKTLITVVALSLSMFLLSGCGGSSKDESQTVVNYKGASTSANNMTCNKTSNNNNGVLSGYVKCTFDNFSGEKQVSFDLKNKPKPDVLSLNYETVVSKGTVNIKLVDGSGKVFYEKTLTKSSESATLDLNLQQADEVILNFKGTKTASGKINFVW